MTTKRELNKDVLDKLVFAKYLFNKSEGYMSSNMPFGASTSILHLHDAVEIVLRCVGEIYSVQLNSFVSFNELINLIVKTTNKDIPQRITLNRLNTLRTSLKHQVIHPKDDEVHGILIGIREFMSFAFSELLNTDITKISLATLINHIRTEIYINKAEYYLENKDYGNAVTNYAIAFKRYSSYFFRNIKHYDRHQVSLRDTHFSSDSRHDGGIREWSKNVGEAFENLNTIINIIGSGINYVEFMKFMELTPYVAFSPIGKPHIAGRYHGEIAIEDAIFCRDFVFDSILRLREQPRFETWHQKKRVQRIFKVIRGTAIKEDCHDEAEPIVEIPKDTELEASFPNNDRNGYICIYLDNEEAYVKSEDLELIFTAGEDQ